MKKFIAVIMVLICVLAGASATGGYERYGDFEDELRLR